MLDKNDFLLNFSPMRPVMKEHNNKLVLILGKGEIEKIA
jgi:hypothetical protein